MHRKLLYIGGIAVLVIGVGWAFRVVTAPRETPQLEAPTGFGSRDSASSASRDDHRKRRAGLGGGEGRRPIPVPRIELRDQPEPEAPVEALGREVRDPGELDPEEALERFQDSLATMDAALDGDLTLTRDDQHDLYRAATGSFEALSGHVDGRDPQQLAFLEQAHREMKTRMKALKLSRPVHNDWEGPRHIRW